MSKASQKSSSTEIELANLKQEVATLDQNWKRALADYQNLLRRVETDRKEIMKMANANLIARLLPSLDVVELTAEHVQDMGVQMTAKQFHQALKEEGLQTIDPQVGTTFDPSLHECTEVVPATSENAPDTIAELILKGYKLNDYVLRPARVKVYKNN